MTSKEAPIRAVPPTERTRPGAIYPQVAQYILLHIDDKEPMTVAQIAEHFSSSRNFIRVCIGKLPSVVNEGGLHLCPEASILTLLEEVTLLQEKVTKRNFVKTSQKQFEPSSSGLIHASSTHSPRR
jgi:hypothetical protein